MSAVEIGTIALPAGPEATVIGGAAAARRQEDAKRMRQTGRAGGPGLTGAEPVRDDPDQPLLTRLAQGDERAYKLLVERHLGRIYGLARRMLNHEHEAEDVAQEAFLRAWRHAGAWQPGRARFETWLYRVTLNLCYDRLRRQREMTVDEMPEVPDETPSVVDVHARRDVVREVEAALAKLPERQRAALVLCHYQELTNAEAAASMEISIDALESLLSRGRRALKSLLAGRVDALLTES